MIALVEPLILLVALGLALLLLPLVVAAFVFWAWMLVDSIRNNRNPGVWRVIWVAAIWFLPFLGSVLYFLFGRNRHRRPGITPAAG